MSVIEAQRRCVQTEHRLAIGGEVCARIETGDGQERRVKGRLEERVRQKEINE